MDELLGGMFLFAAAAVVVAVVIAVAVAMAAAGATVGALGAGILGISAFWSSFGTSVVHRGGARRKPKDPEPAYELYVLGQMRRDLKLAFEDCWTALNQFRASCSRFADKWSDGMTMPLGIGVVVGGYLGTAVAALIAWLAALPIVIAVGLFGAGAWLLVGVLRACEWVRRRVRHAQYECPEDHERFPLPVYICPACNAEHHQLVPSRWGLFRRECRCGRAALPTMVINGRQRIPQRCPSGHAMSGLIGYAENVRVALVGGPSSGKSTFLAGALIELETLAGTGRFAIDVVDQSRVAYDETLRSLRAGALPPKTRVGTNPALVAEVQGQGRSRVLYAYDVAGESYGNADDVRELKFLEVPSGLVLLIDPFAIPHVALEHDDALARERDVVRASAEDPMRVLERSFAGLSEAGVDPQKMPVAVVVAKTDAFGIGDEIAALEGHEGVPATKLWLESHGAGNFVRSVEQEFKHVGWFACSALGRSPTAADKSPFVPDGAITPLLWILKQRGVVPATRPFKASQTQDRLDSGSAKAASPIGKLGWGWRVGLSGASVVAALGAIALGIVSVAGKLVDQGPSVAQAHAPKVLWGRHVPAGVRGKVIAWGGAKTASRRCAIASDRYRRAHYGAGRRAAAKRCRRDHHRLSRLHFKVVKAQIGGKPARAVVTARARHHHHRYRITLVKTSSGWRVYGVR